MFIFSFLQIIVFLWSSALRRFLSLSKARSTRSARTPCHTPVGDDGPVAVPKISARPCGCRLKFWPRPLAHLAYSATGSARFAPLPNAMSSQGCSASLIPKVHNLRSALRQNRIFSPSSTRLRMSASSWLVSPRGSLAVTAMLLPPFSAIRPMPLATLPATCFLVRPAA